MVVCLHMGNQIVTSDSGKLGRCEVVCGLEGYFEGIAIGPGNLSIGKAAFPLYCNLVIIWMIRWEAEFNAPLPFLDISVGLFLLFNLARRQG